MQRTERLLDLVALFLDSKHPVPWSDIRLAFPEDYGGDSADSAERKFERDKAELLDLGISLEHVGSNDDEEGGYFLNKSEYYLPDPGLNPEELALLYTAGSAALESNAFPLSQDLAHALRKLGYLAGPQPAASHIRLSHHVSGSDMPQLSAHLEVLWTAISNRKNITLEYFSPSRRELTRRQVSPYGLTLRRGIWTLVAHCHLRKDVRTFLVHRIRELKINEQKPKSPDFELPSDFSIDQYAAAWPWQHRFHAPLEVTVRLSGTLKPLAANLFPEGARLNDDGSIVHVNATYLDGLVRYVLSLGNDASIEEPQEARDKFLQLLERIARAHQDSENI